MPAPVTPADKTDPFRALADDAPVMIWMSGTNVTQLEFANKRWREFTGIEPHGPIEWPGIIHPDDLRLIDEAAGAAAPRLEPHRAEFRMRNAAGQYRWIVSEANPRLDADGKIVGHIGTCIDITEEKQARLELEETEERLRLIIAATDDAPWDWDFEHDRMYYSPEWWQMLGYEPDELPATPALWLQLAHPDDAERIRQLNQAVVASPYRTSRFEFRLRHKQGHYVPVDSRAYIQRDENGQVRRISGMNSDLTARKLAEQDRAQLAEQLRESQKMEAIGTLAGGIAHDFNNIAAAILGNTELARQDSQGNPEALKSLEQIQHAAERARDLTRQILAFSRRQPTDRKLVDLRRHVEQVVKLMRTTLLGPLRLECGMAPDVPAVLADSVQVEQVLMNLVSNAAQALAGKPGLIRVELDTQDDKVRIRVSDTGPGIDSQILPRLFEPFFTTKPVGQGTGLGLSVAYGIMQAHEGSITVESRLGEGTVFTLLFPASTHPLVDKPSTASAGEAHPGSGQRLLYVDDDEALRMLFQRMMERRGYKVRLAESGVEALDILAREPDAFDLLLVDYNMPGMTGIDVARDVRQHHPGLPVTLASGFITDDIRDRAKELGVTDVLFKPDGLAEYCAAVDRLVSRD